MWFDIIKVGEPRSDGQKKRYNKRLIGRFLDYIPKDDVFTVQDILAFWKSPEQQEYSTEYIPNTTSLGRVMRRNKRVSIYDQSSNYPTSYLKIR